MKELSALSTLVTVKQEPHQTLQDTGCSVSNIPPTSNSLSHHIKRANYQAYVWKKSSCKDQDLPALETNGWAIENDKLLPTLMTKDTAPTSLLELSICKCNRSREMTCANAGQTACHAQKLACAVIYLYKYSREVQRFDFFS